MTGRDDFASMSSGDDSIDVPSDPMNPDPHQPDPFDSAGFLANEIDAFSFDDDADGDALVPDGDDDIWVTQEVPGHVDPLGDPDGFEEVDDEDGDALDSDGDDVDDLHDDLDDVPDAAVEPDPDGPAVGEPIGGAAVDSAVDDAANGDPELGALIDALLASSSGDGADTGGEVVPFVASQHVVAVGPDPSSTAWAVDEVDARAGFIDADLLGGPT